VLDHIGVPVSDFEQSKRFYTEALLPLGYELIMEPSVSAAGFGLWANLISGSVRASQVRPSISPLLPMTVSPLMLSMRRPSLRVGATTVVLGFAPSTIQATIEPSSSILTATTPKQSVISQKKPESSSSYSPNSVASGPKPPRANSSSTTTFEAALNGPRW
jgi:hypothetical protein